MIDPKQIPTPEYLLTAEMLVNKANLNFAYAPSYGNKLRELVTEALRAAYNDGYADGLRVTPSVSLAPEPCIRPGTCVETGESIGESGQCFACTLRGCARANEAPVCSTCNDTHRMTLHRDGQADQVVMCTRCPRPCQDCRHKGNGPFCEKTPCSCECHRPSQRPSEVQTGYETRESIAARRDAVLAYDFGADAPRSNDASCTSETGCDVTPSVNDETCARPGCNGPRPSTGRYCSPACWYRCENPRPSEAPRGEWKHCSPELLASGIDCGATKRRACECGPDYGSHDHLVPRPNDASCTSETGSKAP